MKSTNNLTHAEVMEGLTLCFRELISTDVSHENMPNIVSRGRAVAAIVTAAHREELMQIKREKVTLRLAKTETPTLNKLKEAQ